MDSMIIDMERWERREIFETFSKISFPFYVVSFNVDIQNLYAFCKQSGAGVYHTMVWCVSRAVNSVAAFRRRIIDGQVVEFSETYPSFTFLKSGEEAFKVCTIRLSDSIIEFDRAAKEAQAAQTTMFGHPQLPPERLIYLSCLPWIETTCISSERHIDPDDCIPRISWGKFRRNPDGTITQNITVDANHRLIDGYHIGLFGKALQDIINTLNPQAANQCR